MNPPDPMVPIFHDADLAVTVFFRQGTLNIWVVAARKQAHDPRRVMRTFERDIALLGDRRRRCRNEKG